MIRKTAKKKQLVFPENYQQIVFIEPLGNMENFGSEKVSDLTKQRFHWPYMAKKISFLCDKRCRFIEM